MNKLGIACVVAALILFALAGFVREYSGDFHWHIVLGQWMIDHGRLYVTDVHSHTAAGDPYFISAWLSDVMLAASYSAGGYAGVYLLRSLFLVLLGGSLILDAIKRGIAAPAAAAMIVFILGNSLFRLYLRPETLAFGVFGLLLFVLGRIEATGNVRARIAVFPIMMLWPNLHGSVGIGLMAIGLFCAQELLRELFAGAARDRVKMWWALCTPPAAFVAACVNPEGIGLPLAIRVVTETWVRRILEWQPLPIGSWPPMALVVAIAVIATAVCAGALARRAAWWNVGTFAVLSAVTFKYGRFLTYAMIAAVPAVCGNLVVIAGALKERGLLERWKRIGWAVTGVVALWGLATLVVARGLFTTIGLSQERSLGQLPTDACEFVREQNAPGPVFNSYLIGNYLMYCLGPSHPVFIDGRAWSLYSDEFYERFKRSAADPKQFEQLIDDYPSAWAIVLVADPYVFPLLYARERWRLVYFDDQALVFANRQHPATAEIAAAGFEILNPIELFRVAELEPGQLAAATAELGVQTQRCPGCYRTRLVKAAVAVAAGDDVEFARIRDQLLETKETPQIALLSGIYALERGDRPHAQMMFARFRELGGDPRVAAHYMQKASIVPPK